MLDREILAAVQLRPVAGEMRGDRVTVPVNPFSPLTVMVDVPVVPARTVTPVGLAVIMKSTTWKRMFAVVWDRLPLVPVTLTV